MIETRGLERVVSVSGCIGPRTAPALPRLRKEDGPLFCSVGEMKLLSESEIRWTWNSDIFKFLRIESLKLNEITKELACAHGPYRYTQPRIKYWLH
jgi:hypothetical protein